MLGTIKGGSLCLFIAFMMGCQTTVPSGSNALPEESSAQGASNAELSMPAMLTASFEYHRPPRPAGPKAEAVIDALLAQPSMQLVLDVEDARHLLHRSGFGASPAELQRYIGMTRAEAIRTLLHGFGAAPHTAPPAFISQPVPAYGAVGDLHPADRDAFIQARHREIAALRQWWLQEMTVTPSPLTEKMVLFWHNHFVSAYSDVDEWSHAMARQHFLFRHHLAGRFDDMLHEIIRDPAMLNYLDNDQNRKKKPNENLSRELMELFTLGVGAYTEQDVKEAARALAGWGVSENANLRFKRKPWAEDKGVKSILGHQGRLDADDLIDILVQQEELPVLIASKIWAYFGSSIRQDNAAIHNIAAAFRSADLSLQALLVAVFTQDSFWASTNRGTLIKAPADTVIGAVRSLSLKSIDTSFLAQSMSRLGQTLFEPPNVAGWTGGVDWVSPGALLARDAVLQTLLTQADQQSLEVGALAKPSLEMRSMDPSHKPFLITLAGEDWNGPAAWQAWVAHDGGVWRSDRFQVQRGHDTQRLGRIESEADLIWETIQISVPASLTGIRRIGVDFLNDGAGSDGDRNLFIQSVLWEGSVIPASLGRQSPGCRSNPKGAQRNPGSLYCEGELSFEQDILDFATRDMASTITQDTVYADRIYVQHANLTSKRRASVGILLENLVLNNRRWALFGFELVREGDGQFGLSINEGECYPTCLASWPRGHWGETGTRSLFFPIPYSGGYSGGDSRRHWNGLAPQDKQLVSALMAILPEVVEYIPESRRAKRNPKRLRQWMPLLEERVAAIGSVWRERAQGYAAVIGTEEQKIQAQMMQAQMMQARMMQGQMMKTQMVKATLGHSKRMMMSQTADRSQVQRIKAPWRDAYWNALSKVGLDIRAEDALLAVPPIGSGESLEALILDPAWQVM